MFNEVYSECACWYCEAIRAAHNPPPSPASSTPTTPRLTPSSRSCILPPGPTRILSVPTSPPTTPFAPPRRTTPPRLFAPPPTSPNLTETYQRASQQARKRGREPPIREDHAYAGMAYGVPIFVPYYAPYMGDPCVTGAMYPSNPVCASFAAGAAGNCCQGTCGGGVAAGACGGSGGWRGMCWGGEWWRWGWWVWRGGWIWRVWWWWWWWWSIDRRKCENFVFHDFSFLKERPAGITDECYGYTYLAD